MKDGAQKQEQEAFRLWKAAVGPDSESDLAKQLERQMLMAQEAVKQYDAALRIINHALAMARINGDE